MRVFPEQGHLESHFATRIVFPRVVNNLGFLFPRVEERTRTWAQGGIWRTKVTKDGINRESGDSVVKVTILTILVIPDSLNGGELVFWPVLHPAIPSDSARF